MRSPGQAWKLQIFPISQSQQLMTKIQSVLKCSWSLISQLWINLQFRYNCLWFCYIIPTGYTGHHIMYWNNLWCCMISNFNIPNKKESRLCINSNNCMTNVSKQFYVFSSAALYYVESASYFSSLVCLPLSCMLMMGLQSNQITGISALVHQVFSIQCRAESRFAPNKWETALLCNDVSHWLVAHLESALQWIIKLWPQVYPYIR